MVPLPIGRGRLSHSPEKRDRAFAIALSRTKIKGLATDFLANEFQGTSRLLSDPPEFKGKVKNSTPGRILEG